MLLFLQLHEHRTSPRMAIPRLRLASSQDCLPLPSPPAATIAADKSFNYTNLLNYKSCVHSNMVLSSFNEMRKSGELCDVTLVVNNNEFHCHRALLCANSQYFRAMFGGTMSERHQRNVVLYDVSEVAMEHIIDFFYTSSITITMETVVHILPVARMFQVDRIVDACCEFMRRNISIVNCLGIASFADLHSCNELKSLADDYAIQHFSEVIQVDEFLQLSIELLLHLISSDALNVHSEERVYEAVIAWIKYDLQSRKQHIAGLLDHVSYPIACTCSVEIDMLLYCTV